MDIRVGIWQGKVYRPGDEDRFPDRSGAVVHGRVTGIGDDGTVYVERVEDNER